MKLLNGSELAEYIKERQAKQVRALIQSNKTQPRLAIIQTSSNLASNTYVKLKKIYGKDIGVIVDEYNIAQNQCIETIDKLNKDKSVHGIIVQLPLENPSETDEILQTIDAKKDVDALNSDKYFSPAAPTAIMWLLAGYNIELNGKNILIIGQGKLVGAPLKKIMNQSGLNPTVADENTQNLVELTKNAQIIITATGHAQLIKNEMISSNTVIIDAGLSNDNNVLVGDVSDEVYEREDLTITPKIGGVGPLTISALFDNVIRGAREGVN